MNEGKGGKIVLIIISVLFAAALVLIGIQYKNGQTLESQLSSMTSKHDSVSETLERTKSELNDEKAALATTETALSETQVSLEEMTGLQKETSEKLAATEAELKETQSNLVDMTAKQKETAETLAATETELAGTKISLDDITALQEETAEKLTGTENRLSETQTNLDDMTAKQQETADALAATELSLTETQASLADISAIKKETEDKLAETESELTKEKNSLDEMTALQKETADTLAETETKLAETETRLAETETRLTETETKLTETETRLTETETKLTETQTSLDDVKKQKTEAESKLSAALMNQNTEGNQGAEPKERQTSSTFSSDKNGYVRVVSDYIDKSYSTYYHLIVIENTSSMALQVQSNSLAYDENGTLLGMDSGDIYCVPAGECALIKENYYEMEGTPSYFNTTFTASGLNYMKTVTDEIDYHYDVMPKGIVVYVTNNKPYAADSLNACVLYFRNDEFIDSDEIYFYNSEYKVDAGETLFEKSECSEAFDTVEIYFEGLAYDW